MAFSPARHAASLDKGKNWEVAELFFPAPVVVGGCSRCKLGIRGKQKLVSSKFQFLLSCGGGASREGLTANKEWKQFIKQSTLSKNNLSLIATLQTILRGDPSPFSDFLFADGFRKKLRILPWPGPWDWSLRCLCLNWAYLNTTRSFTLTQVISACMH